MTLTDFIKEMQADVAAFEAQWIAGATQNPDNYPVDLSDDEWFEQYLSFTHGGDYA